MTMPSNWSDALSKAWIIGPSPHLDWDELACHDGTNYPDWWKRERAVHLASVFEAIRAACGNKPIRILSAYRTPEHNRVVGGAPLSQHVEGRALDLHPPIGYTAETFYRRIRQLAECEIGAIKGLGLYDTFVHVDIRPVEHLVTWDLRKVTKAITV